MSTRRALATGLVLVLGAALAWRALHPPPPESKGTAPTERPPPAIGNAAVHASQSASFSTSTAEDDHLLGETRKELEERASAGDGQAARRLGIAFAYCNDYQPVAPEQLEEQVVRAVAAGLSFSENGRTMTPDAMLRKLKAGRAQMDHVCRNAPGIHESHADASKLAFQWIERAAALGDADAQAMYASQAFGMYDLRTALLNAEEVRDRKQRASDYLQQSLAKGDALALLELSRSYSAGMLFPKNPETAYAYLYAYSLTPRSTDLAPQFLDYSLATSADALDEGALQRAREEGRRLATCCSGMTQKSP